MKISLAMKLKNWLQFFQSNSPFHLKTTAKNQNIDEKQWNFDENEWKSSSIQL